MVNQPGVKMLLNKLMLRLKAFRHKSKKEELKEDYSGPTLEIGNELLITEDVFNSYHGLINALGRVVIIDQILAREAESVRASAFGIQLSVDMHTACQMREAYLQRETAFLKNNSE